MKRDCAPLRLVGEAVDEEPVPVFEVEKSEGVLVALVVTVLVAFPDTEDPTTPLDTELIGVHDDEGGAGCGSGVAPSPW